jgi:hypothetical protein
MAIMVNRQTAYAAPWAQKKPTLRWSSGMSERARGTLPINGLS